MTKETVIDLNLNVEEIDGPPSSYFETNQDISNCSKVVFHASDKRFSYLTYSIGTIAPINKEPSTERRLKNKCENIIMKLYLCAYYQKTEGYEVNFDCNQPLIVWRKRPVIVIFDNKMVINFRLVIIPPQEVKMVREHLKSLESSND